MSVELYVVGIVLKDDKFKEMLQLWNLCVKRNIDIPKKVDEYFNFESPDDKGPIKLIPTDKWSDENYDGYEIKVDQIPHDVKIIRVYLG